MPDLVTDIIAVGTMSVNARDCRCMLVEVPRLPDFSAEMTHEASVVCTRGSMVFPDITKRQANSGQIFDQLVGSTTELLGTPTDAERHDASFLRVEITGEVP